jgi:[NiFe] hydrogenase assembly HybE family chaperone
VSLASPLDLLEKPVNVQKNVRQQALYEAFERADARMLGLPVYNDLLRVELRGFQPWGSSQIGILITPWCMNLILLPPVEMDQAALAFWQGLSQGQEIDHALPCGTVRFVVGDDGMGGLYQMCSLFSPMDDFLDQKTAQEVADQTLVAVLIPEQAVAEADERAASGQGNATPPEVSRRDLFRGLRNAASQSEGR